MPKLAYQFAFMALLIWLFSNWIGLHGHFCFDGQEPPVSVHVHLDAHSPHDHHPDEEHMDADVDLLESVIAKVGKFDMGLLLIAIVIILNRFSHHRSFALSYTPFFPDPPPFLQPQLRAPPLPA